MTTITDEPSKTLYTAEKRLLSNLEAVAYLFPILKENGILKEKIEIKVDRQPKEIEEYDTKDFAEQMIYYRNKMGYSQKQVGQAIGVSEDTYRRYELKQIDLTDIDRIRKIVEVLEFEEKPKVSEYVQFLMTNSLKQMLKDYFANNNISKNKFCKLSGISKKALMSWINEKRTISEESYEKLKKYIDINMQNLEIKP